MGPPPRERGIERVFIQIYLAAAAGPQTRYLAQIQTCLALTLHRAMRQTILQPWPRVELASTVVALWITVGPEHEVVVAQGLTWTNGPEYACLLNGLVWIRIASGDPS